MHAVIINMESHNLRRDKIRKRVSELDIDYSFFSACTSVSIPPHIRHFFLNKDGEPWNNVLLPGEIGCYASHLTIMHSMLVGELPSPLLVLEDDAIPDMKYVKYMRSIFKFTNNNPDRINYVNLHMVAPYVPMEKANIDSSLKLIKNYIPSFGTFAYVINREGAEKFLNFSEKRTSPIDLDIIIASLTTDFHVWETCKNIFHHDFDIDEQAIDSEGSRKVSRDPKFRLAYRRALARRKYGLHHDIRFSIARKFWKLRRKLSESR